jgi:hypothetical protein
MLRAFEGEVGLFAFDNTRLRTATPGREQQTDNISQEPVPEAEMVHWVDQLESEDSGANEMQGLDKTEAVRVQVVGQTGLEHDEAHDKMGQEAGL